MQKAERTRSGGAPKASSTLCKSRRTHNFVSTCRWIDGLAPRAWAVVAESRALSLCLATEETARDLVRVLRPGGRMLLCVDSLTTGLARLADQGRWAELADVPAADVLLVPDGDTITRCFWPEELHAMLADAGFEVEWVRPRTVLADEAVSRALLAEPAQLPTLVAAELSLARRREGEAIGNRLVASARRA